MPLQIRSGIHGLEHNGGWGPNVLKELAGSDLKDEMKFFFNNYNVKTTIFWNVQ
jgi:hypothetical protein